MALQKNLIVMKCLMCHGSRNTELNICCSALTSYSAPPPTQWLWLSGPGAVIKSMSDWQIGGDWGRESCRIFIPHKWFGKHLLCFVILPNFIRIKSLMKKNIDFMVNKWQNSAFIVQNSWPQQLIKKSLISGVPSVREGETFFAVH